MAKGRAIPVEGGYRVSGRWPFASGIRHCAWVAGGCLIEEGGGLRAGPDGAPEQRTLFFPITEVEVLDTWHSGGLRGSDSADFAVRDAFVPTHRTCGNGRPDAADPVSRVPFGAWGTASVASVTLGIARAAMDALAALGAKVPLRGSTPLREQVLVQVNLGQAEAMLEAARLLFYEAARSAWEDAVASGAISPERDLRLKLASAHAAETAVAVVDRMHRAGGTSAVYSGSVLDACLRDVHVAGQHAGLGTQHYEAAGRARFTPDPPPPAG
jgi:alkylation response protein AidB-like acyl-CoA dehydrogenase